MNCFVYRKGSKNKWVNYDIGIRNKELKNQARFNLEAIVCGFVTIFDTRVAVIVFHAEKGEFKKNAKA